MTTGVGTILGDAFSLLIEFGFLRIVVPFILFYSIIFGMLERTQIFTRRDAEGKVPKEADKATTNLHSMIAFSVAIGATAASQAVGITSNYLPVLAVVSVVIVGIMMLLGLAFGEGFETKIMKESKAYQFIVYGAMAALVMGALVALGYYSGMLVTPCIEGGGLTPVNSLAITTGQCTKLLDITSFPTSMYVMGVFVGVEGIIPIIVILAVILIIGVVVSRIKG
jgi:hypothetical protein